MRTGNTAQRQPEGAQDPFLTGVRDGKMDAMTDLPYRPPPGIVDHGDRWQRQYLEGYAEGYAQESGLPAAELRPEERQRAGPLVG